MEIAKTIASVRNLISRAKAAGKSVGFVPTMGALHMGHISLIKAAKSQCDFVVVSVFVNPTQFGPSEDFQKYPRPIEADLEICRSESVDLVFVPDINEMYPAENLTWVNVEKITDTLCGSARPGHFRGVATVCSKLFHIVGPDKAFFGQKDAQQVFVIQRMVSDLNFPLEIVVCETIRESDGLAVSSRNQYLLEQERKAAPLIYQSLELGRELILGGCNESDYIIAKMLKILNSSPLIKVEYVEIVDTQTLAAVSGITGTVLIAVAAKLGQTRLIDNILVDDRRL